MHSLTILDTLIESTLLIEAIQKMNVGEGLSMINFIMNNLFAYSFKY